MGLRKEIPEENLGGCLPIATGFFIGALFCVLLSFCACKPTEKIVEIEKWRHDTTTVVDTVHVKDVVVQHDSVFVKEYVTQYKVDSTLMNVAYKYYTYNPDGGIASFLDYTSSTQHGSTAHTATESASTSVNDNTSIHEETSSHSESSGHSEALQSKEQTKRGLGKWQKFVMGMGYTFIVLLALGLIFAGMRLYGKWKKL